MMEVKDIMGEKFHANLPAGRQAAKKNTQVTKLSLRLGVFAPLREIKAE
jgi:hypothetical protein